MSLFFLVHTIEAIGLQCCLFSSVLQNVLSCVLHEQIQTGLSQHKGEEKMTAFLFLDELSL